MRRRLSIALVALLVAAGVVLALGPLPVGVRARRPAPAPPFEGALAPGRELATVELLGDGLLDGPEDVEVDGSGRIYCGLEDGTVARLVLSDGGLTVERFADTGGRPLGLDLAADGTLWVADAVRGLVAVDRRGESRVRLAAAGGSPLRFADDVDVAPDGRVYLSDASARLGMADIHLAPFEGEPSGRLIEYEPRTGAARVLVEGLQFANGIAVSAGGEFVLVTETFGYRVRRHWLAGARRGETELFADNLPGFPDGISSDGRGGFWLALYAPRLELLDRIVLPRPWLQRLIVRLPARVQPGPERYGLVVALDGGGRVVRGLHDPDGERFPNVTSVERFGDALYLGSITSRAVGRYRLGGGGA